MSCAIASQFLKDLTLQSRAIGTNVCQLLTPIVFISFAGIMQVILNVILKKHATPVPGSSPILLPMDISRSLACETNESIFNNPEIKWVNGSVIGMDDFEITNCRDNFLNFFTEHPDIDPHLIDMLPPKFKILMQNLSVLSLARPQDLLFDFPMFYIGK